MARPMVVDAHVHVSAADRGRAQNSQAKDFEAPLGLLLGTMESAGVGQAILVQPSRYGTDHSYLMTCLRQTPGRTAGVVLADVQHPVAFVDQLFAMASERGVVGVRYAPMIRPHYDWFGSEMDPVAAAAGQLGLSINLLVTPTQLIGAQPWVAAHQDLTVIVEHLGHPDLGDRADRTNVALRALARYDNVRIKLSALPGLSATRYPHRDVWAWVQDAVVTFGPERCMWGSDFPFTAADARYLDSLSVLAEIFPDLSASDMHRLCARTAQEVYSLPSGGGIS